MTLRHLPFERAQFVDRLIGVSSPGMQQRHVVTNRFQAPLVMGCVIRECPLQRADMVIRRQCIEQIASRSASV